METNFNVKKRKLIEELDEKKESVHMNKALEEDLKPQLIYLNEQLRNSRKEIEALKRSKEDQEQQLKIKLKHLTEQLDDSKKETKVSNNTTVQKSTSSSNKKKKLNFYTEWNIQFDYISKQELKEKVFGYDGSVPQALNIRILCGEKKFGNFLENNGPVLISKQVENAIKEKYNLSNNVSISSNYWLEFKKIKEGQTSQIRTGDVFITSSQYSEFKYIYQWV